MTTAFTVEDVLDAYAETGIKPYRGGFVPLDTIDGIGDGGKTKAVCGDIKAGCGLTVLALHRRPFFNTQIARDKAISSGVHTIIKEEFGSDHEHHLRFMEGFDGREIGDLSIRIESIKASALIESIKSSVLSEKVLLNTTKVERECTEEEKEYYDVGACAAQILFMGEEIKKKKMQKDIENIFGVCLDPGEKVEEKELTSV
jgi:hypothetical protein